MTQVTIRNANDVVSYINNHPTGSQRGRIIAWVALGSIFIDAYDFTSLSLGIGSLKSEFSPNATELGLLTASIAIGAFLGAIAGGWLVDRLGRYKLLILDLLLFVVAAVAAGLSPNIWALIFFRFLLGIGVGIDMPAALSLISEFSRTREKGRSVNLWQLLWYAATVLSALITLPIIGLAGGNHLWRWAVGLGAVPALIVLILRLVYADESPMWAAKHLGLKDAVDVLRKSFSDDFIIEEKDAPAAVKRVQVLEIFRGKYLVRTFISCLVSCFQAIQYFGVAFYIPLVIGAILGKDITQVVIGTMIINVFGLIGGGTQALATWKLGMRRLTIIGCSICIVALLLLGIIPQTASPYLIGAMLALFIFGHSFGPGAQGKSYAALSFPTNLRGVGTGAAEAASRVGSIVGFFFFPILIATAGVNGTMLWFILVPGIMLISLALTRWDPARVDVDAEAGQTTPTGVLTEGLRLP
ncbi:MFS transporter [Sinomonas atrocyanea]|uniref:MFS transporter n=1 Tax=Sinomonas atrocyanea TaxID=37927 RepID=A0A126ZWM6_9MICC|nr:MFS transporter [Sinomonas atrocyanea]AMM31589.1 MFS transporter [Sinomonas atrocyanea]GEB66556.1 MFS transporter [Sinomonas atrocyanea]GGG57785.1 MFS transporter [Sinomonas atrocyanea]